AGRARRPRRPARSPERRRRAGLRPRAALRAGARNVSRAFFATVELCDPRFADGAAEDRFPLGVLLFDRGGSAFFESELVDSIAPDPGRGRIDLIEALSIADRLRLRSEPIRGADDLRAFAAELRGSARLYVPDEPYVEAGDDTIFRLFDDYVLRKKGRP